jgi:hypothetical protein
VSAGIVSGAIHLASATTKFKLHPKPPGRFFCNTCEGYAGDYAGAQIGKSGGMLAKSRTAMVIPWELRMLEEGCGRALFI